MSSYPYGGDAGEAQQTANPHGQGIAGKSTPAVERELKCLGMAVQQLTSLVENLAARTIPVRIDSPPVAPGTSRRDAVETPIVRHCQLSAAISGVTASIDICLGNLRAILDTLEI